MANTSPERVSEEIDCTLQLHKGRTVQQLSVSCKGRPLGRRQGRLPNPCDWEAWDRDPRSAAAALLDIESRAPAANTSTDAGVDRKNDPDLEEGEARSPPDALMMLLLAFLL
jgi:hypothetical protein